MNWPLKDQTPLFPDTPGRFGAQRTHDNHTGLDLYCEVGSEVVAIRDGIVVGILNFTGPNATRADGTPDPMPWWENTRAVMVEDNEGVWMYAELEPCVKVGDKVSAGDRIGNVLRVLKTFKNRPMVMLHMERHAVGSRDFYWWFHRQPCPAALRNPTELLVEIAKKPIRVFDLDTYDGKKYR